jgi:hypothetical protein
MQKNPPYNTGKVKIGCMYTPPPPLPTPEELWIQSTLLGDRINHDGLFALVCFLAAVCISLIANVYTL